MERAGVESLLQPPRERLLSLAFKLLDGRAGIGPWAALALAIPAALALGIGCYFAVERPLLKIFHPGRRKGPALAAKPAPAAAAFGVKA